MRKSPATLTFKQRLGVVTWISANHERLMSERTPYTVAAAESSKYLGYEVSAAAIRSISRDCDLAWNGNTPNQTVARVNAIDSAVSVLCARVDALERALNNLLSQLGGK